MPTHKNKTSGIIHPDSGIDITAPGGIQQLLDFHRQTFGDAAMKDGDGSNDGEGEENSGDNGESEQKKNGADEDKSKTNSKESDKGFPADTPLSEMTVEQREAYWKDKARKHENTARARSDYDEVAAKAAKWDQHEREQVPAQERAVQEAEDRGRQAAESEAASKYAPALVRATFQGLLASTHKQDEIEEALEPLDLSRFLKDDLTVDTDKVKNFATRITGTRQTWPGTGTGNGGDVPSRMSGADIASKYL